MAHAGFASMAAIVPQMSSGYSREGSTLQHREYFDRSMETGAGGIFTTGGIYSAGTRREIHRGY